MLVTLSVAACRESLYHLSRKFAVPRLPGMSKSSTAVTRTLSLRSSPELSLICSVPEHGNLSPLLHGTHSMPWSARLAAKCPQRCAQQSRTNRGDVGLLSTKQHPNYTPSSCQQYGKRRQATTKPVAVTVPRTCSTVPQGTYCHHIQVELQTACQCTLPICSKYGHQAG